MEEKKFSFQNQKVMLTYKTHLDKKMVIAKMNELIKGECKFVRVAHETGDENHPYLHTHVLIDFGKRFQSKNCRIFDLGEIHPNIQPVKTKTHFTRAQKYLAKEDKDNADLLETNDVSIVSAVWECKTVGEALERNAKKYSDVSGIVQLYKHKEVDAEEKLIEPRQWQINAKRYFDTVASDRAVVWLFEEKGNIGKTIFLQYLEQEYGAKKCLYLTDFGRMTDTANIVQQEVESGWTCEYVLIDLKRSMRERESIYPVLEGFKDRRFTNTKYMGGRVRLRVSPRVLVVANWEPNYFALSLDRWHVIRLTEELMNNADPEVWEKSKLTPLQGVGGDDDAAPPCA